MTAAWHVGPIEGAEFWWLLVSSPEILVFLFFMITDPKTIPASGAGVACYAVGVGLLATLLIAPQTTEFATKVAILAALCVVVRCARRRSSSSAPSGSRLCAASRCRAADRSVVAAPRLTRSARRTAPSSSRRASRRGPEPRPASPRLGAKGAPARDHGADGRRASRQSTRHCPDDRAGRARRPRVGVGGAPAPRLEAGGASGDRRVARVAVGPDRGAAGRRRRCRSYDVARMRAEPAARRVSGSADGRRAASKERCVASTYGGHAPDVRQPRRPDALPPDVELALDDGRYLHRALRGWFDARDVTPALAPRGGSARRHVLRRRRGSGRARLPPRRVPLRGCRWTRPR